MPNGAEKPLFTPKYYSVAVAISTGGILAVEQEPGPSPALRRLLEREERVSTTSDILAEMYPSLFQLEERS